MTARIVTRQRPYRSVFCLLNLTILVLLSGLLSGTTPVVAQNSNDAQNSNIQSPTKTSTRTTPTTTTTTTQPNTTTTTTPPTTTSGATSPTVPPAQPSPTSTTEIKVIAVWKYGHERDDEGKSAGLEDIIVVKVQNLQSLIYQAKCLESDGKTKTPNCHEQEIVLYLDGRKIENIPPESGAPKLDEEQDASKPENGTLRYHLRRTTASTDNSASNDEAWADIFGDPPLGDKLFYRETDVSVGLANGYPVKTDVSGDKGFNLTRIRKWRFWFFSAVLLLVFFLLWWLARHTNLLRDVGPSPGQGKLRPYSLARWQMAIWFSLAIVSFLYIWQITGATDIITPSVLGLIGIGAGTALGSAAIDVGKRTENNNQLESLQAETAALQAELPKLDDQIKAVPPPDNLTALQQARVDKQARLNLITAKIPELSKAASPKASERFLTDILSDADGVSFHRFQMFVWTIVLGVIFVYSVWTRLSMPEFSTTLLALMGISAGTFVGFKIPEKQA